VGLLVSNADLVRLVRHQSRTEWRRLRFDHESAASVRGAHDFRARSRRPRDL